MGDSSAVELEFENIKKAVTTVKNIADDIGELKSDFAGFASGVSASAWSTEPSCMAFGESYKSALSVYTNVLAGMQADLANYSAALDAAAKSYEQSDANATAALTKLGTADDTLQQDAQGRTTYEQAGHHEDLNSAKPEQAPDTSPTGGPGTTFPGTTGGGGDGGTGANPANNAVDPTPGAGSPAGPTGSSRHGQS